jgi:diguanylate cyclase (GGDEF)-like protein
MNAEKLYEAIADSDAAALAVDGGLNRLPMPDMPGETARLALKITTLLQTTLDVEGQIELFSRECRAKVPHDSIGYLHDQHGIAIEEGKSQRNSCAYRLTVEERLLGEIRFTRLTPFTEQEIADLEFLLCALVYPLRNALDHRIALEEARRDVLTGVNNRCVLDGTIAREVGLAHRHQTPLSVIFLDIDKFKDINDTHGHHAGDRAIQLFANILQSKIRVTDVLIRYGGDEFVIVLANTPIEGARLLAERIRVAVESSDTALVADRVQLTASVGVTTLMDGDTAESFLRRADDHLHSAKRSGRNKVSG